jgi:ribosomal protein S1
MRTPEERPEGACAGLFADSDGSMACLHNTIVQARVVRTSTDHVFMDIGYKAPVCLLKEAIPHAAPGQGVSLRLTHVHTPDNESLGESSAKTEVRDHIWDELKDAKERKQALSGVVLNMVKGGYSIGIAGYVAFLPQSRAYSFRGTPAYTILHMNARTRNIVLAQVPPRQVYAKTGGAGV